jgi:hypothetical protein
VVQDIHRCALLPRFELVGVPFARHGLEGIGVRGGLIFLFYPLGLGWIYAASELRASGRFDQADFRIAAKRQRARSILTILCESVAFCFNLRPTPTARKKRRPATTQNGGQRQAQAKPAPARPTHADQVLAVPMAGQVSAHGSDCNTFLRMGVSRLLRC